MAYRNRLCFLGNQSRTAFFQKIAEQFDRSSTRISWIVVNAAQKAVLSADGYDEEDILYLPLSTQQVRAPYPVKINDLVFCDRRLMHMRERGLAYLRAIQAPMVDFLETDLPTLVVGELTYAYEVLAHRLVKAFIPNAEWVSPFLTRVPAGYFAFFADEAFSREVWPVREGSEPRAAEAESEAEKIGYAEMNRKHIARQGLPQH